MPEGTGTPLPPFRLTPFWTEMDPLGHVNHPRYVDWADEALAVHVAAQGGDPIAIVPVAERLRFRGSAKAGDAVEVRLSALGGGAYDVWMGVGEETVCTGTLVRTSTRATDRQPGGWVG